MLKVFGVGTGETGRRTRIGLIAPASDILIERDFWRMGLAAGADIYTTRVPLEMPLTPENLRKLGDGITAAAGLLLPDSEIDAVVFGCTSGSAVIGSEVVASLVHAAIPSVQVTNPALSAVEAFRHLACSRIAFVAPYTPDVAQITAGVFEAAGIAIADGLCFNLSTDVEIAQPTPEDFLAAVRALDLGSADAIFLSCTTSRALDAITDIEAATGLSVVTSNQAAFWHAMRLAGHSPAISGFGQLLALPNGRVPLQGPT